MAEEGSGEANAGLDGDIRTVKSVSRFICKKMRDVGQVEQGPVELSQVLCSLIWVG